MLKIFRYIVLIPIFLLVVALAVANRTPVSFSLNPFDPGHPSLTVNEIPLFVLLFGTLLAGILLGGIFAWLKQGKWRHKAREGQREISRLRRESDSDENSSRGNTSLLISHTQAHK